MSLPIAACLIDRNKNFIAANERYAALMRRSLGEIIGSNMVAINPPAHVENVERDLRAFESGGFVPDHEITLNQQSLLVSVSPFIRFGEHELSGLSITLQDITSRKRMELELLAAKQEIEDLAQTDSLTGVPNRRGLDIAMEREIAASRRQGAPLSLAMVDVDFFKAYNDLYGHLAGDTCLAAVARVISAGLLRPRDFVARYGGEEFVILLPQTDLANATSLMESIRDQIERRAIIHEGTSYKIVTASVGVACVVPKSSEIDTMAIRQLLIGEADRALYHAKDAGRNRVIAASNAG